MNTPENPCPKCGSAEVHFRKTRADWQCDICEHAWKLPETGAGTAAGRTKIFLSYGRLDASDLAGRLKNDLEAAGYEVWQDTNRVRAGVEWEDEIRDGLRSTQVMIALLSPHAVRTAGDAGSVDVNDSVCLDEISFARFSKPATPIVPVMAVPCEPPFCIFRLDYVNMCEWKDSDEQYETGFRRLLESIDDNIRGKVRYRWWEQQLRPWDFAAFLNERRQNFCGRQWLFEIIEEWRMSPNERALLLTGEPGIGKSALVAELVHRNPGDQVLAYHCCQSDTESTLAPARFISNIAAMIASKLPDYAALLSTPAVAAALEEDSCMRDPASSFEAGILAPLENLPAPSHGVRYILIDAIDESLGHGRGQTIAGLLESRLSRLPSWLRILMTSRPDRTLVERFGGTRTLHISSNDFWNLRDAEEFINLRSAQVNAAERVPHSELEGFQRALLERSAGNFLFLQRFFLDLERNPSAPPDPLRLPEGLCSQYLSFMKRDFPDEVKFKPAAALLSAAIASPDPVDEDILATVTGIPGSDSFHRALRQLSPYMCLAECGGYKVFHDSFARWLASRETRGSTYHIEIANGHRMMASAYWSEYRKNLKKMPDIAIKNLIVHLAGAEMKNEAAEALADLAFIIEKRRRNMLPELLLDYTLFDARWGAAARPAVSEFAGFVRRNFSVFAADGDSILQQALNEPDPSPIATAASKIAASNDGLSWLRLLDPEHSRCHAIMTLTAGRCGINSCAFSPAGPLITAGCDNGTLIVWDVSSGKLLASVEAHTSKINFCAFLPDGSGIISAGEWPDHSVKAWDLSGRELFMLSGHETGVTCCSFAPEGGKMASTSQDGSMRIWSLATASSILSIHCHASGATACAFSPDGRSVVTASHDRTARIWDAGTGTEKGVLKGHGAPVLHCAFSPDGSKIATASADRTIKLWNSSNLREIMTITGHTDAVASCTFSPDGRTVFTASHDRSVRAFSAEDGRQRHAFYGHGARINHISCSPDGTNTMTASADGCVKLWSEKSAIKEGTPAPHAMAVEKCEFSPDGRSFTTISQDGLLAVWSAERHDGRRLFSVPHNVSLRYSAFSPGGKVMATGGMDGSVRFFETAGFTEARAAKRRAGAIEYIDFSPDGSAVFIRGADGTGTLLSHPSLKELFPVRVSASEIILGRFAPGGDLFVTANSDRTVRVWSVPDGGEKMILKGYTETIKSMAFHPGGKLLAVACADRSIRIREISSGHETAAFSCQAATPRNCLYSPNGIYLLAFGGAGDVHECSLWDTMNLSAAKGFEAAGKKIRCASFSPGGAYLAISTFDRTLEILSVPAGKTLMRFHFSSDVISLDWSRSGGMVVAGDGGGRIYKLEPSGAVAADIPAVTAWTVSRSWWNKLSDSSEDRIAFGCPLCVRWNTIARSFAGKEIACPSCKRMIKLNSFTITGNWEAISESWNSK